MTAAQARFLSLIRQSEVEDMQNLTDVSLRMSHPAGSKQYNSGIDMTA